MLRLGQRVAVFEREKTTQQEVVHAITAGMPTQVPARIAGVRRRGRPGARRRTDDLDRARRPVRKRSGRPADDGNERDALRLTSPAGGTASARAISAACRSSSGLLFIFQTAERELPHRRNFSNLIVQLAGRRRSRWVSSSCCFSGRSTSRSGSSSAVRRRRGSLCVRGNPGLPAGPRSSSHSSARPIGLVEAFVAFMACRRSSSRLPFLLALRRADPEADRRDWRDP